MKAEHLKIHLSELPPRSTVLSPEETVKVFGGDCKGHVCQDNYDCCFCDMNCTWNPEQRNYYCR